MRLLEAGRPVHRTHLAIAILAVAAGSLRAESLPIVPSVEF